MLFVHGQVPMIICLLLFPQATKFLIATINNADNCSNGFSELKPAHNTSKLPHTAPPKEVVCQRESYTRCVLSETMIWKLQFLHE